MTQTGTTTKFTCCGCGRNVGEEEVIENLTQEILDICNNCVERPFSQFVIQPYTNQYSSGPSRQKVPP